MSEAIITAFITGGCALVGVIISSIMTVNKTNLALKTSQAITDTKLEALANEVRKHNNFAERIPAIEEHLKHIDEDISDLKKSATNRR